MLNLTYQERQVFLFLIAVVLISLGSDFLIKRYSPLKTIGSFTQELSKVDLNSADKETLMNMPGIGEKLAQRIIDYRKQNNDFSDVEELRNIQGITKYRYEKLKNLIQVK